MNFEARIGFSPSSDSPLVYLITKGDLTEQNFASQSEQTIQTIKFAIEKTIHLIQIREKLLSAKLRLKLAKEAVELSRGTKTKILINDRADIAIASKAHGVHFPASALPVSVIRSELKHNFIIGSSTHSQKEAERAKSGGADFVTFSPVFETPSKAEFGQPQGIEKLSEVCKSLGEFPVIALGGINKENYQSTLDNGAKGFAAIQFLNNRKNLDSDFWRK